MTTLDHLTQGRIGWNAVTGCLDSAAKGLGRDKQNAHDDRYEIAEDYMDVVTRCIWASLHRPAHPFYTRQAPRLPGGLSPLAMPNASSYRARPGRSLLRVLRRSTSLPKRTDAIRRAC